jgi:branched-chain amino acid transport system ATP-binding protein
VTGAETGSGTAAGAEAETREGTVTDALTIDGVTVEFAGVRALDRVSLSAAPGALSAVIGPNGAGKSTLFNVVTGFYRPAAGEVRYGGAVLTRMRPHRIARLGVARTFQNLELSRAESVRENIMLGRYRHGRSGVVRAGLGLPGARGEERAARERCGEIAELMGLAPLLDRPCGPLPYGTRKRVEIARALASDARLLLLDEPVAGMSAAEIDEMAALIRDVHAALGLTILLIEHDVRFVLGLADHVTVLDFGEVIAAGTPAEIRENADVVAAYLGTQPAT